MQLLIRGKNLEVTESLRALVEGKLGKLDRYLGNLTEVEVELTYEKTKAVQDRNHVDVSLLADGSLLLRAEARGVDMRTALDNLADVIQGRIVRHKEKLQERGKVSAAKTAAAVVAAEMEGPALAERERPVVETQQIEMKPLSVEEALDEMSMVGRDWFLFINADSGQVNLLQRRADGNYTLFVPGLE